MGDNLSTLVFWLIIGLIAVIGGWLKTRREAKEREARERRKIEARMSTEPRPSEPAPPIVPEESETPREPAEEPDAPPSPLEEFRRMVREAQDRERRRQEGLEPPPPPPPVMHAPPPPPVSRPAPAPRLVPTLEVKTEKVDIPVAQTKVERMFSDRDRVETARLASKGPSGAGSTLVTPAPDPEAELVAIRLADIYTSDRSDIAKAVILREVLGPPVAYRHRVIPPVRS